MVWLGRSKGLASHEGSRVVMHLQGLWRHWWCGPACAPHPDRAAHTHSYPGWPLLPSSEPATPAFTSINPRLRGC